MKLPALLLATLVAAAPAHAQTAPAAPPPACADPNHHAFDFWVGHWDVRPYAGGPVVAHSLIESLYGGCAIRENWMPIGRTGGGSLSNFDKALGHWHQSWVDSSGTRVEFSGGAEGKAMVLTGLWGGVANGKDGLVRMIYTSEPNGAVRQKGEISTDNGKSWGPSFDLLYTPSPAT
jgi:hypothetical protein